MRHLDVLELRGAELPPRHAHRPQRLGAQPRRVALDQERADAARALVAGAREHDVGLGVAGVADEALLPVEHPRVAVALGAHLERGGVGADRGLGQRVGAVALAAHQRREPLALLLLGAGEQDRQRHELHVRRHQRDRAGELRQLLDVGAPGHLGRVAPAVLGRQREPHQPLARERLVDVVRVVAVLVQLAHARADLLQHDPADVLAQLALLIGQTPHVLPLSDGGGGARASRAGVRAIPAVLRGHRRARRRARGRAPRPG